MGSYVNFEIECLHNGALGAEWDRPLTLDLLNLGCGYSYKDIGNPDIKKSEQKLPKSY